MSPCLASLEVVSSVPGKAAYYTVVQMLEGLQWVDIDYPELKSTFLLCSFTGPSSALCWPVFSNSEVPHTWHLEGWAPGNALSKLVNPSWLINYQVHPGPLPGQGRARALGPWNPDLKCQLPEERSQPDSWPLPPTLAFLRGSAM